MTDQETKSWFTRQIDGCADSLYGVALRLTRNSADAEDLVAEAVGKAWSAVATLKDRTLFRSWMFRILHNCFVSSYRKKSVRPVELSYHDAFGNEGEDDITGFLIEQSDDYLSWWGSPEHEFANKILGRDILAAIDRLPEEFSVVITLVTVEGLTYTEAGEVLGIPSGTVHSRMKRGRTLLQKALWVHATDAGILKADKGSVL